ncbi:MAG TPA: hypothetical protein VF698_13315, partial [Thermoanaerobaculia bacterium]
MTRMTWWLGAGVAAGTLLFAITRTPAQQRVVTTAAMVPQPVAIEQPAPVVEPPPAAPSAEIPTLVEAGEERINRRIKALAAEMGQMWTRNPEELVTVIDDASRTAEKSPSVTLLLAIAHAETNGKILDVSEAGAVGLAQATPVAYRQENFDGKLFVTDDYLIGSRAYIVKKPLGDADTIASMIVDRDTPATRARAKKLLKAAKELRREGLDELDLLEPYASERYFAKIKAADVHNRDVLSQLGKLLDRGSRAELRAFRNRIRTEYRAHKATQLASWKVYQKELAAKRDAMLEAEFGMPATRVKKEYPYEAGEFLGEHLDERFSAKAMASFLVRHLDRKSEEARKLAKSESEVEGMTAALYNGGS